MLNTIRRRVEQLKTGFQKGGSCRTYAVYAAAMMVGIGWGEATKEYNGGLFPATPFAVVEQVGSHGIPQRKILMHAPYSKDTLRLFIEETRTEICEMACTPENRGSEFKATVWPSAMSCFLQGFLGIDTRTAVVVGQYTKNDTYAETLSAGKRVYDTLARVPIAMHDNKDL